ncbi:hypothetical protein QBC41DRAFT_137717 [Cercophora samala]|uniref:Uncharacterized protein n=1 Tax=Cercophora samala TaxID=330535 RepID=A0AA40DB52_9PEZI|nr:hypothetical protein QBC41DRAFT_137717 [Cercophora samala]
MAPTHSRNEFREDLPIHGNWAGQYLLISYGDRVRIIAHPTTYAQLIDVVHRGFGISGNGRLTLLVKHVMPQGNTIEAELDESAYYLVNNQSEIRCVDTLQHLRSKDRALQVPFSGHTQPKVYSPYGNVCMPTGMMGYSGFGDVVTPFSLGHYGMSFPTHSTQQQHVSTTGTLPTSQNGNPFGLVANKSTIDGAATTGQDSKQPPVNKLERDPQTGPLKDCFLLPDDKWARNPTTKLGSNLLGKGAISIAAPPPHNLSTDSHKLGGRSQAIQATEALATPSCHDKNPKNPMIHPNLWKPVITSVKQIDAVQDQGKGVMKNESAGESSKSYFGLSFEPKHAFQPESITNSADTAMTGDSGKQVPQSALASSSQPTDHSLVHSYLVASTYMTGGKQTFCKPERELFGSEFARCKILESNYDSILDVHRDSKILETLLGHTPGCHMRRSLNLNASCDCGGPHGPKECCEKRLKPTTIENFLECAKVRLGDTLDRIGDASDGDIEDQAFDFHNDVCFQGICVCDIFETLAKHDPACRMRRCLDIEAACDCTHDGDEKDKCEEGNSCGDDDEGKTSPDSIQWVMNGMAETAKLYRDNNFTEEEWEEATALFHNEWCHGFCCCMRLRDFIEHNPDCSVIKDPFADWSVCECKKRLDPWGTSDVYAESDRDGISVQFKQDDTDDRSDNAEDWTPSTGEGNSNYHMAGRVHLGSVTGPTKIADWLLPGVKDFDLPHWCTLFSRKEYEDDLSVEVLENLREHFLELLSQNRGWLRRLIEKSQLDPHKNRKGKERATEETTSYDLDSEGPIEERDINLDELSDSNMQGLRMEEAAELAAKELDRLEQSRDRYRKLEKSVVTKVEDHSVKESSPSASQTNDKEEASDDKKSTASSSSWVPVKNPEEGSVASSSKANYRATVEDLPKMPSASGSASGGPFGLGLSSSSIHQ